MTDVGRSGPFLPGPLSSLEESVTSLGFNSNLLHNACHTVFQTIVPNYRL